MHTMNGADIGAALTASGVTIDGDDTVWIESLIVLAKTRDLNTGDVAVDIAASTGLDAITQLGIIDAAHDIVHGVGNWHHDPDEP